MISEERLRQAARKAGEALADSLPEPEDCWHDFSPAFEKRMAKLLRRSRHRALYKGLKRVACFLLVCLLGSGAFLTVNAEAREAVFGWISEKLVGEHHYFFDGSGDAAKPGEVKYALPEIPEGYEPFDLYEQDGFVSNAYLNDAGQGFRFEYIIGDATEMWVVNGEAEKQTVRVHGKTADFYPAESKTASSTIVWRDEETDTLLYISGFFNEDRMIQLAESVIREEK